MLYEYFFSPIRPTYAAHLNLFDLISLIILSEEHKIDRDEHKKETGRYCDEYDHC
jgi:hypothetical protein